MNLQMHGVTSLKVVTFEHESAGIAPFKTVKVVAAAAERGEYSEVTFYVEDGVDFAVEGDLDLVKRTEES